MDVINKWKGRFPAGGFPVIVPLERTDGRVTGLGDWRFVWSGTQKQKEVRNATMEE
jgi:hypothetical protein